jgi:hypothetical protein
MYTVGFVLFAMMIFMIFGKYCSSIMPCTVAYLSYETTKQRFMGNNRVLSGMREYLLLKESPATYKQGQTPYVPCQGVSALPRIIIASRSCQVIKAVKRHIEAVTPRRYEIISVSNDKELAAYTQYRKSMSIFLESNFFGQDTPLKLDALKKQFPSATITVVDYTGLRPDELAWFFLSGLSFISLRGTDDEIRRYFRVVL